MATASFDTFTIVKDLQAAGMPEEQATAVMKALRDARDLDLSKLATKADVREVVNDLRVEMYKLVIGQAAFILAGVALITKFLH